MSENFVPIDTLEKALTGTALHHVDFALRIFNEISVDEIINRKTRLIFRATLIACDSGLLETAKSNFDVIVSILESRHLFPDPVSLVEINDCLELGGITHAQTNRFLHEWQAQKEHRTVLRSLYRIIENAQTSQLSAKVVIDRIEGGKYGLQ